MVPKGGLEAEGRYLRKGSGETREEGFKLSPEE